MDIIKSISLYLLLGVFCNMLYDWAISNIEREELRFNNYERAFFCIVWPIYALLFIINFIKSLIDGND